MKFDKIKYKKECKRLSELNDQFDDRLSDFYYGPNYISALLIYSTALTLLKVLDLMPYIPPNHLCRSQKNFQFLYRELIKHPEFFESYKKKTVEICFTADLYESKSMDKYVHPNFFSKSKE
jgi:hypothetical protein